MLQYSIYFYKNLELNDIIINKVSIKITNL